MDEVIRAFNGHRVRYLLIGGQAMRLEGMPRFSMDWDLYIPPLDLENIALINELLDETLDIPLVPRGEHGENFIQTYQTEWGILQFHLGGAGLPRFDRADNRAVVRKNENGTPFRCMCTEDLLASKKAANRPIDKEDILFLEAKLSR
ncbi:MAG: hypothetical protein R6V85_13075 [Polyangia bacterium]